MAVSSITSNIRIFSTNAAAAAALLTLPAVVWIGGIFLTKSLKDGVGKFEKQANVELDQAARAGENILAKKEIARAVLKMLDGASKVAEATAYSNAFLAFLGAATLAAKQNRVNTKAVILGAGAGLVSGICALGVGERLGKSTAIGVSIAAMAAGIFAVRAAR